MGINDRSSQGEQRMLSLSIKLSLAEMISKAKGEFPVILLDDVFSELDVNRRVSLLSGMVDAQIFITCTEREYIENELNALISDKSDIRFFHVDKGIVTAE